MANEYVKLWLSYEAYFQPLGDAEVGRLVLGMMKYKSTGTEPVFNGNERFVWPAIKRDIDEAKAAQERFEEKQRDNGKKGGRPSKTQAFSEKPTETQKNPSLFRKTKKPRTKDKGQRIIYPPYLLTEIVPHGGIKAAQERRAGCDRCMDARPGAAQPAV